MKKYDNFAKSLAILKRVDYAMAVEDEIYRMGVVGQFQLTFELAWKALQAVLRLHGVSGAENGSPRDTLKLGYSTGFLDDAEVWLLMLKKRNAVVHVYDEEAVDELLILIRDSFTPAFCALAETLLKKIAEGESDSL